MADIMHSPRGRGLDRRPIIVIDGRNFKPGPKETLELARRMTAKQIAANWFWCCLELTTMALFFAGGAAWVILARAGG